MINKAFAMGTYLWIYDLEEDNTFRRDPEQLKHLKKVIELRAVWLKLYGQGIFRDTVGVEVSHPDIMAKLYNLEDGSKLVAINNIDRLAGESIRIDCTDLNVKEVKWHSFYEPETPINIDWNMEVQGESRYMELELKDCELALIYLT